jgi:hypothetical protein
MIIEWKPVPGASDYEVSTAGAVFSYKSGKLLRPQTIKNGYQQVWLSHDDGATRWRTIHRLVLEAFVGPPEPGQIALHGEKGVSCNCLSNLSWGTYSQNSKDDRERDGTDVNGHRNGRAKLSYEDRREIHRAKITLVHELAERFQVSTMTIWRVMRKSSVGLYDRK